MNLKNIYLAADDADVEFEDRSSPYTATTDRLRGVVRRWDEARGFGFIKPTEPGPDVFVHYKSVVSGAGHVTLREGELVTFALAPKTRGRADRGPRAIDVRVHS